MTTDKEHLTWIRNRLVKVYKEPENVDFVLRLDKIIEALPEEEVLALGKVRVVYPPEIEVQSGAPWWRRLVVVVSNPFLYVFQGRIRWQWTRTQKA